MSSLLFSFVKLIVTLIVIGYLIILVIRYLFKGL